MKHLKFSNLFYILITFYLNSCISSENKIFLDQTTSFQIPANSKLVRIIQTDVDYYQRLTNQSIESQLILYKILKGSNYQMYIGVAIDITSAQIHHQLLSSAAYNLVDIKTPTFEPEAMLFQIDSNRFCYHHIKQLKKGDIYIFSVISKDKDFLEAMVNSNIIENSVIDD